jgi:hypothetical protein
VLGGIADFKLFGEAYDAFRKLVADLGSVVRGGVRIPADERQKYRDTLDDTMSVIDHALLLVIHRLSDLLETAESEHQNNPVAGSQFLSAGLARLNNVGEWDQIERQVRLCQNLRIMQREMQSLIGRANRHFIIQDEPALDRFVTQVLHGESELANEVTRTLARLAALAPAGYKQAREEVQRALGDLKAERKRWIALQAEALAVL